MQRFTVYRRKISQCPKAQTNTPKHFEQNPDHEPQFEGVIWTDGTVSLRWLTQTSSWSTWSSIEDMINVHGHLEYGTDIQWHDGEPPAYWQQKVKEFEEKKCQQ